jgi:phosphate ABC transporter phosphate-binding protein
VRRSLIGLVSLVCLLPGCSARTDRSLDGTGSTFVAPLLDKWSQHYQSAKGVKVVYESVGSGIGLERWKGGLFDFCCSDAPLNDKQLGEVKANRGDVLHIPLTLGAVVPVYNLEGIKELVLSGSVLSDIYLGNIKKWNEQPLQDLNPGIKLPDQDILVVHRQDASGTTYIWTDYLSKVDEKNWTPGTSVNWPVTGASAFGNAGVASRVQGAPGSIGYVSLQEAVEKKLSIGKILRSNHSGKEPVVANAATVAAAVNSVLAENPPEDLRFSLTNARDEQAWPICGTTWAIVSINQTASRGQLLKDFLTWATQEDGQKIAEELHYVRLPKGLVERVEKKIGQITVGK